MTNKYAAAAKYGVAGLSAMIAFTASSMTASGASSRHAAWPAFTVVVEKSNELPPGWSEFCRNYKSECEAKTSEPHKVVLTTEVWNKLVEVNNHVNTAIKPTADVAHWGRSNKWTYAEDGKGDCKDYVLAKQRMLLRSGLPRDALLIAAVWTPRNKGHAILLVRTDKGDYALDSLLPKIALWKEMPYEYVMRQSQTDPNTWLYIDGDPLKPAVIADKSIAENPTDEALVMITGLDEGKPKQQVIAAGNTDRQEAEQTASRAEPMAVR